MLFDGRLVIEHLREWLFFVTVQMRTFFQALIIFIVIFVCDISIGDVHRDENNILKTMQNLGGKIQFLVTFRNEFLDNHTKVSLLDSNALYPFFRDEMVSLIDKVPLSISSEQYSLKDYLDKNGIVIDSAEKLDKHPGIRYLIQGWYVYCHAKRTSDASRDKHLGTLTQNSRTWQWRSIKKYIVCNSWAMEGTIDAVKYFINCPDVLEISTNLPYGQMQADYVTSDEVRYGEKRSWNEPYSRSEHSRVNYEYNRDVQPQRDSRYRSSGYANQVEKASERSICDNGNLINAPNHVEPNIQAIKADKVWHITKGRGVILGVADTGVDKNAIPIHKNYAGAGKHTDDYYWWDSVRECYLGQHRHKGGQHCNSNDKIAINSPQDSRGHGTFVCTIAVGSNGLGVAPEAKWMASRNMLDGDGSLFAYIDTLDFFIAPTKLSGDHPDPGRRPHVIVNSYTCAPNEGDSIVGFSQAIRTIYLSGIFMAVAAGNQGDNGMETLNRYPAVDPLVTTVGAAYIDGRRMNSGSSKGPIPQYLQRKMSSVGERDKLNIKPDLVAPGRNICAWESKYPHLVRFTGTSMATPHVAGAALLLCSAFPHLVGNVDMIRRILINSAAPLDDRDGECSGHPNHCSGYGLLQIDVAFDIARRMKS